MILYNAVTGLAVECLEPKFIRWGSIMKKLPFPVSLPSLSKYVSAPALLHQVRQAFEQVPDPRRYGQQFSLPDVLMSGLAVFGLKYPSLLKFDEQRNESTIRANLKALYGVDLAPCDTQLRAVLDRANPTELRTPFVRIHQRLYQKNFLERFLFFRKLPHQHGWDRSIFFFAGALP